MRVLPVAGVTLALLAPSASADVGVGPPVNVAVAPNAPLAATLRATVAQDDPEHPIGSTFSTLLKVAGRTVARLDPITVAATPERTLVLVPVPAEAIAGVLDAARQAGVGRATATFVITPDDDPGRPYGEDSYLSLAPGQRTDGRTRLVQAGVRPTGAPRRTFVEDVLLKTPTSWLRTSRPRAGMATFAPVAAGPGCTTTVVAVPELYAARSITTPLDRAGGTGDTFRAAHTAAAGWRIRASRADDGRPRVTAIGLRRWAPHRYAGVVIDISFEPGCPATAARAPRLIAALAHTVASIRARVHAQRRAA